MPKYLEKFSFPWTYFQPKNAPDVCIRHKALPFPAVKVCAQLLAFLVPVSACKCTHVRVAFYYNYVYALLCISVTQAISILGEREPTSWC